MFAPHIEALLLNAGSDVVTDSFVAALVVGFLLGLGLKKRNRAPAFTHYVPTLLTTLGILGTFAGIIAGLLGFDVNQIDSSINELLEGLKTAFTTSLVGMTLSIVYKLLLSTGWISPRDADQPDEGDIGIGELHTAMRDQVKGIHALHRSIEIKENGEAGLMGQLKALRTDLGDQNQQLLQPINRMTDRSDELLITVQAQQQAFNDFQQSLWTKLDDFADMLSKSATEQVIKALEQVIGDFNSNLTEQFGQNFSDLNAAVLALVQWQENYKQQLKQMAVQYQQGVEAITETGRAVTQISEASGAIPEHMAQLKTVIESNQYQLQQLERHLTAFQGVRDRAVEAVPEIRSQIDQALSGMKQATATMNEGLSETTRTLTDGLNTAASTVTGEVSAAVSSLASGVNESSASLTASIASASDNLVSRVTDATDQVAQGITTATHNMSETVADSSTALGTVLLSSGEAFRDNSERVNQSLQSTSDVISRNSEQTRQMFDDALSETNSILRNMVADLKDDSGKLSETWKSSAQSLITETGQLQQSFTQGIERMRSELEEAISALVERQALEHERVLSGLSQRADEAVNMTGEAVQKQMRALEEATQHQLNVVMNEAGQALTAITGQFTNDYRQLVGEMQRVTRSRVEG